MNDLQISKESPLLLGSGSPRRRDILTGLGIPFIVRPPDVEEDLLDGDSPELFLERVVGDKLAAVLAQPEAEQCAAVLVADTIVVVDSEILGKPEDQADAVRLLSKIAGRGHTVMTRYAICARAGQAFARTVRTEVSMRALSDVELLAYAATGEGLDKAGAYAIQGIGAFLVKSISGSYTNVVGLPACEVVQDLLEHKLLAGFPSHAVRTGA